MVKPLSEQLANLSVHAKKAEDDVASAQKETHEKIVARREQLRVAAEQGVEKLKRDMKSAMGAVSSGFSALEAKVSADAATLKANVQQLKKELGAELAESRADNLEWEADMAIEYAISAVEQAKLAAIDAMISHQQAIEARKTR